MLLAIVLIVLGVLVLAGFMFMIGGFANGIGQVIAAKRRGEPIRPVIPPSAQKWAAKQSAKYQTPIINVTVQAPAPIKEVTPEQKAAGEKAEERKRYLDSLVDR